VAGARPGAAKLLDLYAARETETVLKQQAETQARLAELLGKQVEAGAAAQVELTQARINLNTTRLALQDAQRQTCEARAQLAGRSGARDRVGRGGVHSRAGRFPTELTTLEVRRRRR